MVELYICFRQQWRSQGCQSQVREFSSLCLLESVKV